MAPRVMAVVGVLILVFSAPFVAAEPSAPRIIDLTYAFSSESIYWPTADGFSLRVDAKGMTDLGYYYTANSFCAAEHGGTHLDAPVHFAEGMASVERISLSRLLGPAILIDVAANATSNPDYLVSVEDILAWERMHGPIPEGNIVLLRTGWGRYYPDKERYLGTDRMGPEAVSGLHFPGLDPKAAKWLVQNRSVSAIGLDTASIDHGQSRLFESHQILFKAGIPVFENVANLEQLPEKGFEVVALPMKIKGGSGAPLRIIALIPR